MPRPHLPDCNKQPGEPILGLVDGRGSVGSFISLAMMAECEAASTAVDAKAVRILAFASTSRRPNVPASIIGAHRTPVAVRAPQAHLHVMLSRSVQVPGGEGTPFMNW
jgi:hypothetical protein